MCLSFCYVFFFFQAEDGIRDADVTGVQTCALPICRVEPCRDPDRSCDAPPGVIVGADLTFYSDRRGLTTPPLTETPAMGCNRRLFPYSVALGFQAAGSMISDTEHETYFPAVGHQAQAHARVPGPDEDPRGSRRYSRPPRQGSQAPGRLSRRVRRRLARCRMFANPVMAARTAPAPRLPVVRPPIGARRSPRAGPASAGRSPAPISCCRAAFPRRPAARPFPLAAFS